MPDMDVEKVRTVTPEGKPPDDRVAAGWKAYLERVEAGPFGIGWGFWLTVIPAVIAIINLPREWQIVTALVAVAGFLVAALLLAGRQSRSRRAADLELTDARETQHGDGEPAERSHT